MIRFFRFLFLTGLLWPIVLGFIATAIFGNENYVFASGTLIGSIILLVVSYRKNTKPAEKVLDPDTGEEYLVKPSYKIIGIRVEWVALTFIYISILTIITDLTELDLTAYSTLSMLFVLVPKGIQLYKKYILKMEDTSILKVKRMSKKDSAKGSKKRYDLDQRSDEKYKNFKLSDEELKKKEIYIQMKKQSGKLSEYQTKDHSKYLPK